VEDKGAGATFVAEVAADAAGEPVVDSRATIFVRDGGSGRRRAAAPKAPPSSEGPVAAEFTRHVDEEMPARYAQASGDHNPIHLDDAVARAAGLPGVINHGLGTLSLVAGGLVDHLADGDAGRLGALRARFTEMVFPGSDLTTVARDSGAGSFLFETTRPDGAVVLAGSLEVAEH
jgi:acyl dehydratase